MGMEPMYIMNFNKMPHMTCHRKKNAYTSPTFEHQGWNAGKGDCGHYRSHLGFSILMGRGFIEVGGWSREEPGEPLSLFFFFSWNLAGHVFPPPEFVAHRSLTQSLEPRGHASLN